MKTETREVEILFKSEMTKAILAGMKTQSRRVVKVQPQVTGANGTASWRDAKADLWRNKEQYIRDCCPYGSVGDMLWVREKWAADRCYDHMPPRDIPCGRKIYYGSDVSPGWLKSRPSIHMPRWASRITLEITDVRIQRLQEISGEDALAEGCSAQLLVDMLPKIDVRPAPYWLSGSNDTSTYCDKCVKGALRKARKTETDAEIDGGYLCESDSPESCETCGLILDYTLTEYGERSELEHFGDYGITKQDAYAVRRMLNASGCPLTGEACAGRPADRELQGRIARMCFRYLWDQINGKRPGCDWNSNPFCWCVSFRRLETA